MENDDMTLFESFRHRILEEIIEETRQISPSFILIADKKSLGIMSGAVQVLDLTERGVAVIESLEKQRKSLPEMDALYFLTPSHKSVSKLLSDFAEGPSYRLVHLYFTGPLSDPLFQSLASSELLPRVRSYKEANCGFRMYDHECFSLECPGLLSKIYLCKSSSERQGIINYLATGLASLCGVLHDLPYVCFQEDSLPAQELALALEGQIDALYRKLSHLPINDSRPVLIILDRNYDLGTPLAHDVHYEALLKDLYEVGPDGNVSYQSVDNTNITSTRQAVINEFDELWLKLKFQEIDEAQGVLNQELKHFRDRNVELENAERSESHTMKTMAKVASGLGNYNQQVSKFAVHRYLIDACMKMFAEEGITEISEIEQMILTGFDTEKNEYKEGKLIENAVDKISMMKNSKERLRLALLILVGIEVSPNDRKMITDLLPPSLALHLTKLSAFGLSLQSSGKSKKRLANSYISELRTRIPAITKIFSYYVPKIHDIINAALKNTLPSSGFIFTRSPPNLGDIEIGAKVQSVRKKQNPNQKNKRKVIIFILGGVSYSELRAIKDFPDAKVMIGGSRVFSPLEFVEEITEMSRESDLSDLDPRDIELDFR